MSLLIVRECGRQALFFGKDHSAFMKEGRRINLY